MEINERVRLIRKELCEGSNNKFAERLGISAPNASIIARDGSSVGKKTRGRILTAFPEVSEMWLLNGEGEMLKTDAPATDAPVVETPVEGVKTKDTPAKETKAKGVKATKTKGKGLKASDVPAKDASTEGVPAEAAQENTLRMDNPQYVNVPTGVLLNVIEQQSQTILSQGRTIAEQQRTIALQQQTVESLTLLSLEKSSPGMLKEMLANREKTE
jgi:hypothetical protein